LFLLALFRDVNHTCANTCESGWWFPENASPGCHDTKLTGQATSTTGCNGMYWRSIDDTGEEYIIGLKKVFMRVLDWNATVTSIIELFFLIIIPIQKYASFAKILTTRYQFLL